MAGIELPAVAFGSSGNMYLRLASLLIEEGTKCVRDAVLNHLKDGDTLSMAMTWNKSRFENLRRIKRITKAQFALLYPTRGEIDVNSLDMTLWVMLGRNITDSSRHKINWAAAPKDSQKKWQHDIIRIRDARNRLFHMFTSEGSDDDCNEIRAILTSALVRLGCPREHVDDYFSKDLDPIQSQLCEYKVQVQHLQDMDGINKAGIKSKRQGWILIIVLLAMTVAIVVAVVVPIEIFKSGPKCSSHIGWQTGASGQFKVLRRPGWDAREPNYTNGPINRMMLPVPNIVIYHTAMVAHCEVTEDCCNLVRRIQDMHLKKYSDIAYNYLIGDDGTIFEGRGYDKVGASTPGWNHKILSLAFLGNYMCETPSRVAFTSLYAFIEYMVENGIVAQNYTLLGHCQTNGNFSKSPGTALMRQLVTLSHWSNDSVGVCDMNADCVDSLYIYCRPPFP